MDSSRSEILERAFPKLTGDGYEVTSPQSIEYNCIAWAAGDDARWWEPDPEGIHYWPANVARDYSVDSFIEAFRALGYEVCDDGDFQPDQDAVALFVKNGLPVHAARRLPGGRWTSKCGEREDITHELNSLEGDIYGTVAANSSRPSRSP